MKFIPWFLVIVLLVACGGTPTPPPTPPGNVIVPSETAIITDPIFMELVRVPAGEFLMGGDPSKAADEFFNPLPQHPVTLSEFYIGKTEVTNAQYAAFVKATGRTAPDGWQNGIIPAGKENHPVVFVSWNDAMAFAQWLGEETGIDFRLPTEAEWEKAARGTDGREYPWGGEFDAGKCNTVESGIRDTTPVGKYSPAGDSPYGVADMAGNVWEWTSSLYKPYPYDPKDGREAPEAKGSRVVRGGSWLSDRASAASAVRGRSSPDDRDYRYGFRVVVVGWRPNA